MRNSQLSNSTSKQGRRNIMAKILVVDDEPDMRFLARVFLEKAEHSVVEAEDGESALGKIVKDKPDIVLIDVMLPGEDGWEICKKIKSIDETKGIPVAMFTIRSSDDAVERSMKCGADAHIKKPFEREELLATIDRLLGLS